MADKMFNFEAHRFDINRLDVIIIIIFFIFLYLYIFEYLFILNFRI